MPATPPTPPTTPTLPSTPSARRDPVPTEPADVGPRAAWRYLCLAAHALVAPAAPQIELVREQVREHLPAIGLAMRFYLLFNFVLYGVVGLAFLVPSQAFHIGRTGLGVVDAVLPHVLWGLSALAVSLSQIAALLSDRWRVWQVCAVGTAVWASALGVVTLVLAHNAGTYTGAILWFWVTGVHFLLISHQLVPHEDQEQEQPHHLPLEALPDDERSIVETMEHLRRSARPNRSSSASTGASGGSGGSGGGGGGGGGGATGRTTGRTTGLRTMRATHALAALPAGLSAALPLAAWLLLSLLLPLR